MSAWGNIANIPVRQYMCGYCEEKVASEKGWQGSGTHTKGFNLYVCPNCSKPSFFVNHANTQQPSPTLGQHVDKLPDDIAALYAEARTCTKEGCFTAATMLCRKMLMNISVEEGAKEGLRFVEYVDFLFNNHHVPPKAKQQLKLVKDIGNESNHKIQPRSQKEASQVLNFLGMVLKFNYEYADREE